MSQAQAQAHGPVTATGTATVSAVGLSSQLELEVRFQVHIQVPSHCIFAFQVLVSPLPRLSLRTGSHGDCPSRTEPESSQNWELETVLEIKHHHDCSDSSLNIVRVVVLFPMAHPPLAPRQTGPAVYE